MSDQQAPDSGQMLSQIVSAAQGAPAAQDGTEAPVDAEAAPEAPAIAPIELAKPEDKFASKFAALSKREKQLRAREQQVTARLAELEAQYKTKETEISTKYIDPAELRKDPLGVMRKTGLTLEQLAEIVLNDGKQTPEMLISQREAAIMAKFKEMEDKLTAKETAEQEAKLEQTLNNFKGQINEHVSTNNEYELIRANDAADLVYDVIEEHHANTGEILDIKQASDAVENYLLDEVKKQIALEKVKSLLGPQEAKEAPKGQPSKTLSNAAATTAPQKGSKKLSAEESVREAAKLIKWTD